MNDLTTTFPEGVKSIQIGAEAGNWQAFVNVSFGGTPETLEQGHFYKSPGAMGLDAPVKSMRKAV